MQSIFGTDGIRGIFDKELTYYLAYKVGYALGVLTKTNNPIILGRDTVSYTHLTLPTKRIV